MAVLDAGETGATAALVVRFRLDGSDLRFKRHVGAASLEYHWVSGRSCVTWQFYRVTGQGLVR